MSDPDLAGLIQTYYKDTSKYLRAASRFLTKSNRITLSEIGKVLSAINYLIEFCSPLTKSEQQKLVQIIFAFAECRQEEIDKESGSHDAHVGALREFHQVAEAIKYAMNNEPDFKSSSDIKALYNWFYAMSADGLEEFKNFQPRSKYPDLIFELTSFIRKRKKAPLKEIYSEIDSLLHSVYPSGLRRSRTMGALAEAYKEGQRRARK